MSFFACKKLLQIIPRLIRCKKNLKKLSKTIILDIFRFDQKSQIFWGNRNIFLFFVDVGVVLTQQSIAKTVVYLHITYTYIRTVLLNNNLLLLLLFTPTILSSYYIYTPPQIYPNTEWWCQHLLSTHTRINIVILPSVFSDGWLVGYSNLYCVWLGNPINQFTRYNRSHCIERNTYSLTERQKIKITRILQSEGF